MAHPGGRWPRSEVDEEQLDQNDHEEVGPGIGVVLGEHLVQNNGLGLVRGEALGPNRKSCGGDSKCSGLKPRKLVRALHSL